MKPVPLKIPDNNFEVHPESDWTSKESYFDESVDESLVKFLKENAAYEREFAESTGKEVLHFIQFTGTMLWAFPLALYMRWKIRKNKQLNYILQFKELLQVRNNIEKGSFAYDTLLFKQSPVQLLSNKSHLANLVCLAILFGDEFIDGVATEYGKSNVQKVLANPLVNYYLQYKYVNNKYELCYEFDICDVLPQEVLGSINKKYGITYKSFYQHLQFLLSEMNRHLNKLDTEITDEVATLICKACNKCFDTYKADINEFDPGYTFTDLLQYQKTKDDDIIQILLTLRAVLLNKKQLQYQKLFSSWSSMVRSMQLYDDMQDVAGDCNFQMNTLCYFAKKYFVNEWEWLQKNIDHLQQLNGLVLHATVSLHMPGSCIMVMQYARNIGLTKLNWVQRKIQNYLWQKNWLGFTNPLLSDTKLCISIIMDKADISIPLKLHFIKMQVMKLNHPLITDTMKWAFISDIILMDEELREYLYDKMGRRVKYYITSCFIEYPVERKARIAKQLYTENLL